MLTVAALLLIAAAPARDSAALATVQRATAAVEAGNSAALEQRWGRALASAPRDREALLGLATISRLTYRFERADTLARLLLGADDEARPLAAGSDAYTVMARITLANLAVGRSPARADSILAQAGRDAAAIPSARLQSSVLVSLASLRARTSGARVGLALLTESRRLYPRATPMEEALRLCSEGGLGSLAGEPNFEAKVIAGINLATRARAWRVLAECRVQQGALLEARGLFEAALKSMDDAALQLNRVHADAPLAVVLQRSAFIRAQRGELARARNDYLAAVVRARRARNASAEAWSYGGLAGIAITLNDLTGARPYLETSIAMHRAANDRWGLAAAQEMQGSLFAALGDVSAARTAFTGAVDAYIGTGQRVFAIAALRRLALLELDAGRVTDAERALDRATTLATATRNRGWFAELPYLRAGVAMARDELSLADSLLRSMDSQFTTADLAYSYWIRRAELAARRNEFADAERAADSALVVLHRWRAAFADKDIRLRIAEARRSWGAVGPEFAGLIARLAQGGRVAGAFALAEGARARELATVALQQAASGGTTGREAVTIDRLRRGRSSASLADVQGALDDSTAMLAFVANHGGAPTTVFTVTRRTATATTLAPVDSIATLIDRYSRLLAEGLEPTALATTLSDAVVRAPIAALPAGITRLVIVAEQSFYRVPFDALKLADGRFLVERFGTVVVPSATELLRARVSARTTGGSLLAFGDVAFPRVERASLPEGERGIGAVEFPRLPVSGDEARRVARYASSARVLTRGLATERTLRTTSLAGVRVVHLATHAIVDDRSLQGSMIALAPGGGDDGRVGPAELGALRFDRALVVLSGCRTAGGVVLGGEGLRGLVAPLLEAGAAAVLATGWPVGDASILPMIDRFYWHASEGADVGTALRRAKLDAIRAGVPASVWSALTIVGDGTLRLPLRRAGATPLPWRTASSSRQVAR